MTTVHVTVRIINVFSYPTGFERARKETGLLLSSTATPKCLLENDAGSILQPTVVTRTLSITSRLRDALRLSVAPGLSAPSGLSTFRGVAGMWREYNVMELATFDAFKQWPVRVWQFYAGRRSRALAANPNRAHYALAELAKQRDFITVSQNVDGLSPRANHPDDKIFYIHGSLFELRCESCEYVERNFDDPLTAALKTSDDEDAPLPDLPLEVLPHCPACGKLLRPNVVWFYEDLPENDVKQIKEWMDGGPIDLLLVIGTSSNVNPAARYSVEARSKGARVAVFNLDGKDKPFGRMRSKDWFFQGDAAVLVPELLKSVVGEVDEDGRVVVLPPHEKECELQRQRPPPTDNSSDDRSKA